MIELNNAEEQVVIDIEAHIHIDALRSLLEYRRDHIGRTSTGIDDANSVICIYRVPQSLTEISPKAILPEMVSIGPYHLSKESESYKLQYLDAFLSRINKDGTGPDLVHLFKAVGQMEKRARRCYDEVIPMSSGQFIEMMVLDGCFIIELFRQMKTGDIKDDDETDRLVMDLLKLENQLPFFILERLFSLSSDPSETDDPLALLALKFFNLSFPRPNHEEVLLKISRECQDVRHLLDLFHSSFCTPLERNETQDQRVCLSNIFHNCMTQVRPGTVNLIRCCCASPFLLVWWSLTFLFGLLGLVGSVVLFCVWWAVKNFKRFLHPTPDPEYRPSSESIQCTTQLRPSGVTFKPLRGADSFLVIDYQKRVLQIPPITINNVTSTFFINSIALEQCCPRRSRSYFTTYIAFMSCLINSPRDVAFLSGDGIITSCFLHNDHGIAVLFNKLGEKVYFDKKDCYLSKQFRDVEAYYNSHWGTFLRTYFSAPWSFISVVSACILLLLAGGQTVVSIMSYIKEKSKEG